MADLSEKMTEELLLYFPHLERDQCVWILTSPLCAVLGSLDSLKVDQERFVAFINNFQSHK